MVSFGAASILCALTLVQFNPFVKMILLVFSFLRIVPLWTLKFKLLQHLQCCRKETEAGKDFFSISFHEMRFPDLFYYISYLTLHLCITA